MLIKVFEHRPGDGQPVKGRGSPPDFIQQNQRPLAGAVQDGGSLGHLHHKGGTAARQVVAGPDAGEDAVDHGQARRAGRHERAHLRHNRDQRRLPQVSRLAAHVGPGHQQNIVRILVQEQIVGHEALPARLFLLLDHRMPPADYLQHASVFKAWAGVAQAGRAF